MRLSTQEQQIVQEGEETRAAAMRELEHGTDLVIVAQLLAGAGDLYREAALQMAGRAKREAKARRTP